MTDPDLELYVEDSPEGSDLLGTEFLPDGIDHGGPWCCLASFTSASCPGSTFACVGSFSSGC